MRKQGFLAAAIVLLIVVMSAQAHAAFSFREKEPEPELPETGLDLTGDAAIALASIGPGHTEKKQSQGSRVTLPLAIELITPSGWNAIVEEEYRDKEVSWRTGPDGDWVETLESIGRKEGLRFVVNWRAKEVAAGAGTMEALAQKTNLTRGYGGSGGTDKEDSVSHLSVETMGVEDSGERIVTVAEKPWELEPGGLKSQLEQWSERAGYSLIWDSQYDYRLDAGSVFYGDFKKAVQEVIMALYRSGARIKADIYTRNNVLYISGGQER